MKANELMIGDWVYIHHGGKATHYGKVTALPPSGAIESEIDGSHAISSSVEPIPITPEILEKNGFVQNPRSKSRRSHQICTDSVYISWWRGRLNILFKPFIGHSTNHVNVDGKYVHELQHALRICGIEKEIVL